MSCSVDIAAIADACMTCCLLAPNYEKITGFTEHSRWGAAHIVALPELCCSGYGFHSRGELPVCRFSRRCERVQAICGEAPLPWTNVATNHLVRCRVPL
jgi:predicted amidohydrolase